MGLVRIYLREQGRYEELVRQGGVFAELDTQGRFVPDAPPDCQQSGPTEEPAAAFRDFA